MIFQHLALVVTKIRFRRRFDKSFPTYYYIRNVSESVEKIVADIPQVEKRRRELALEDDEYMFLKGQCINCGWVTVPLPGETVIEGVRVVKGTFTRDEIKKFREQTKKRKLTDLDRCSSKVCPECGQDILSSIEQNYP